MRSETLKGKNCIRIRLTMNLEKDFEKVKNRFILENITIEQFELLKSIALNLYDLNMSSKEMLLKFMRKDLIGTFEE